jgi:hypothetical protein
MKRRNLISVVTMFVVLMLSDFVVHGMLLHDDYMQLTGLYRTESDQQTYFLHMLLAHVFLAVGMVWVYLEGRKDAAWLPQGIRFGLAIIVLLVFPTYMIYYSVLPMPALLAAKQIGFDSVTRMFAALVLAWINR